MKKIEKNNKKDDCNVNSKAFFTLPYKIFAPAVVSLPLVSLFVCFITSILTKYEKVNETVCGVSNFIPSISAITGSPPQAYVWRICIALHSTPRLMIAVMYYNYWLDFLQYLNISQSNTFSVRWYKFLVNLNLILNIVENMSLVGVTYISNVENYPLHEKIFVVFMVTSCTYMSCTLAIYAKARQLRPLTQVELKSHKLKKYFFATIMSSTAGLLFYFYKHRVLCEPNAWSKFSLCEYVIVVCNVAFHGLNGLDFYENTIYIASDFHPSSSASYSNDDDNRQAQSVLKNKTTKHH